MILDTKKLNKNIPIPLYYQLKELLPEDIKINKYSPGDPIPTEFELSEHFKISRPTVWQAISEPVNERYLYRVKGKGTFEARSANELNTKLLDIEKGDPIHYFETAAWLEDGRPVEYSIPKYKGYRNKFTVEIDRK